MHGLYQPGPLGCGTGWNGPPNTEKRGAASYLWPAGTSGATSPSPRIGRRTFLARKTNAKSSAASRSRCRRAQSTRPRFRWTCSTTIHLFTEKGTNTDSVLYRAGPTGYRLAQVNPASPE